MTSVSTDTARAGWYRGSGKRIVDVVASAALLIVLSPIVAATALILRVAMGSPVLFKQERAGLHGHPFTLLKFRSMLGTEDDPRQPEDRLTPLGSFLRRTSLDELPELWNVLRGEMSLVGPRPLLVRYNDRYSEEQARRLDVLPGITGWAQVHGRNDTSWSRRLAHDVWYVDNLTAALDAKIVLMTIPAVLGGRGVTTERGTFMPEFTGQTDENHADG